MKTEEEKKLIGLFSKYLQQTEGYTLQQVLDIPKEFDLSQTPSIPLDDIKEIKKEIISLKIEIAKIQSGQSYLTWIIGLCFLLTISIGLGTVWKLFEVVRLVSR